MQTSKQSFTGKSQKRKALIVLGMHRSGTSALAGLLNTLGGDGPATPMQATKENPQGYFESERLHRLHDDMLRSAGTNWCDYRPIPETWLRSSKADEYREYLGAAIEKEYGRSGFFVVKDPRVCRFASLWIDLLYEMGVEPIAIHISRNPLEVAESLHARDNFSRDYSYLLWLRHVLDAEVSTRDLRRSFTSYDNLLENWPGVAQKLGDELEIHWPRFSHINAETLNSSVKQELKHHRISPEAVLDNPLLSNWLRETFSIFRNWEKTGENLDDHARLDQVRQVFNESVIALGSLVHPWGDVLKAEREASQAKLAEAHARLDEQGKAHEAFEAERAALRADRDKVADALTAERKASQAKLAEAHARLDEQGKAHEAFEAERAALRADRDKVADALTAEREASQAKLAEAHARLDEQGKAYEALKAECGKLQSEREAAQAKLAEAETRLTEQERAHAALEAERAAMEAERNAAQRALTQKTDEKDELQQHLDLKEGEISGLIAARDRQSAEISKSSLALLRYQRDFQNAQMELSEQSRAHEALKAERGKLQAEREVAQAKLAEAHARLDEQGKAYEALKAERGKLQSAREAAQAKLAEAETRLTEQERAHAALEAERAAMEAERNAAQRALTQKTDEKDELQQHLDLKEGEISGLIAARDRQSTKIAKVASTVSRYLEDLEETKGEIDRLQEELTRAYADARQAEERMGVLLQSTSWKISYPLRLVSLTARKIFRK
ncbi:hypothetical protein [Jannaschia formosa]|uniref:hypothetical protein n=1 Tax=Jannaschia formosa TaxID=2259592 RepID=UPI0010753377|nr:hypothetical protein [Jannaschia formosa]TFL15941.1 hypothetical protein DR046_22710 [Jannaschia formosa]